MPAAAASEKPVRLSSAAAPAAAPAAVPPSEISRAAPIAPSPRRLGSLRPLHGGARRYAARLMKLYGTITSPFVRRVRAVAEEVGVAVELVDTASEEGQATLRLVTPIRKVPVAKIDGRLLFDSRVIIEWLTTTRGYGALAPPADRWREANLVNAIDAAIDSAIQVFYLRRDGIPVEGTVFAQRQMERIDAIFEWLAGQLTADGKSFASGTGGAFSLAELSMVAALDWMEFRKAYPTERAPRLLGLREAWAQRPSIAGTRPQ